MLGALVGRAVRGRGRPAWRATLAAMAAIALFGAVDELHQALVPGRSADVLDWVADVVGGMVALLLATARVPRRETT